MTRVIHTGDTHIGYQQYNSPDRRRDFLRAFRGVVDDAISDDVDAVIHAGDLFHDRRPGLVDLQGTVEVLRTLSDADIPFLAVVGNHESKRDAQWLDLFEDLGLAIRLGPTPHVIDDVAFYGLDFVPRSQRDDLSYEFETAPTDHAALVSHGLFEPFAHADWDTETVLEAATVDFDAMLLGDNHTPDTAEVVDTWVTYCGSTERASASERADRGYNLVTFDTESKTDGEYDTGDVAISRRGLECTREFVFVDVELVDDEGIDRIRERIGEYDLTDAVVIVTISGSGTAITPASVEEFATERGALIARVNDQREVTEEDELSVSFADPDEAVRQRIRELGLSEAAREIDRTVRDETVVDANVRETVERRVRESLEDDRSAFEPVSETDDREDDDTDGPVDTPGNGSSNTICTEESELGAEPKSELADQSETVVTGVSQDERNGGDSGEGTNQDETDGDNSETAVDPDESTEAGHRTDDDTQQVSMGDFS